MANEFDEARKRVDRAILDACDRMVYRDRLGATEAMELVLKAVEAVKP